MNRALALLALLGVTSSIAAAACSGDGGNNGSSDAGGNDGTTHSDGTSSDASDGGSADGADAMSSADSPSDSDSQSDSGPDASGVMCTVTPCATEITAGDQHACALLSDNTVRCWGSNYYGMVGQPTDGGFGDLVAKPTQVNGLGPVAHIAAGWWHTCALQIDGHVYCWGYNRYQELARTTTNLDTDFSTTPVQIALTGTVTQLASGGYHSCALMSDGTMTCWGMNTFGQTGTGSDTDAGFAPVVTLLTPNAGGVTGAIEIGLGGRFSCARFPDASVGCFGINYDGQLGLGTTDLLGHPMAAAPLVSGPVSHVCRSTGYSEAVILAGGGAQGWGTNSSGEVGAGAEADTDAQLSPVSIQSGSNMKDIQPSNNSSCALMNDGTVACWGAIANGVTGIDPATADASLQFAPHPIGGAADVVQITTGWTGYGCALERSGAVVCWGDNEYSNLGRDTDGAAYDPVAAPVQF